MLGARLRRELCTLLGCSVMKGFEPCPALSRYLTFPFGTSRPLEVHELVQLVNDLDQVGLVGHHLGDGLVGVGVFVD